MKQTLILICLSFFICFSANGQSKSKKVDISMGPEEKGSKRETLSDIIGFDETGFYAIKIRYRIGGGDYTLEKYNKRMEFVRSVDLVVKEEGKRKEVEGIYMLDGKLMMFTSFYNQKQKKKYVFVQEVNKKTLNFGTRSKKIGEYPFGGNFKLGSWGGSVGIQMSRDSSKVLLYSDIQDKKKENDEFKFQVFDTELNELWSNMVKVPYENQLFDIQKVKVDNDGNVYMVGLKYKERRKLFSRGDANYEYKILAYTQNGATEKEYDVKMGDRFLSDLQLAIDESGDLICGGFYSDQNTFNVKGSYFLRIDKETQEVKAESFKEFSIESMFQESSDKAKAKAEKKKAKGKNVELFSYDLDEIILRADGGAVMIGEQFYTRTYTRTDAQGNMSSTTYFYFNDIIVVNVSPSGEIEWVELVPKRQSSSNDGGFFSSYASAVVDDKLYLVFNDHANNLMRKEGDKVYRFTGRKDALVVLVEIDKEGNETREALFTVRESDIITRPKVSQQLGVNSKDFLIYGQKKKTHRFVKLTFK